MDIVEEFISFSTPRQSNSQTKFETCSDDAYSDGSILVRSTYVNVGYQNSNSMTGHLSETRIRSNNKHPYVLRPGVIRTRFEDGEDGG